MEDLFFWFLITSAAITGGAMLSGHSRLAMGSATGFMVPVVISLLFSAVKGDYFSLLSGVALLVIVCYPLFELINR